MIHLIAGVEFAIILFALYQIYKYWKKYKNIDKKYNLLTEENAMLAEKINESKKKQIDIDKEIKDIMNDDKKVNINDVLDRLNKFANKHKSGNNSED